VFVAIEVKAMLIGQSADPLVVQDMKRYLEERPEIARVFNLITLQLGNDVMVSVKVQMATVATVPALLESLNRVESEFRQRYPQTRWSFFEPDSSD
jgi:divalent metal cation (Fe/Co/Zn/Cd) transporter